MNANKSYKYHKKNSTIQVWDLSVRLFHWLLLIFFVISYLTSEQEEHVWHIYSGYMVSGLIIYRVIWGLIGPKYARFSDFICSPVAVFKHIKELKNYNSSHYVGHNPAGGWMIIALLISLLVVTTSGLKIYAIEADAGPFSFVGISLPVIDDARAHGDKNKHGKNEYGEINKGLGDGQEELWEDIHEVSVNITLFLILLHIFGVIISSKLENKNLVKSMITGKK